MAGALPADIASGLQYGPKAQIALNRSRYLAQALQAMNEGAQQVRTPTELWSTLLATAITRWSKDKADRSALEVVGADRQDYARSLLEGLRGPDAGLQAEALPAPPPPAEPPQAAAPASPQPGALAMVPPPGPVASAPLPPAAKRLTSEEARALAAEIVPGARFTSGPRTREEQESLKRRGYKPSDTSHHLVENGGLAWDMVPPKGADIEQFRRELTARGAPVTELLHENKGGPREHWHWAFGGGGGGAPQGGPPPVQYAGLAGAPPPPPPPPPGFGGPQPQPFSAPTGPPAGAGMVAPAASPPQAAAAGATTMRATQQQLALAEQLLSNPRTYEQGLAYAMKLRQELAEPVKWESTSVNNVPYQVNPYTGERRAMPIPQEAMTQVLAAQQAGIPSAPQGLYVQRDPLGNIKEAPGGPPQGYGVQGDGYSPIRGGPADPRREQAPPTGYEYRGGAQQPIQGGPADPRNPQAILSGTESMRRELAPVLDVKTKLQRNIEGVRVGLQQRNGVGDVMAINGLQRLIDEGVVREGDVALQLKAQGLDGGIAGLRGYMTSDGFFADPAIRQKLATSAEQLHTQIDASLRAQVMGRRTIVDNAFGAGTFDRFVFTPDTAASLGWGGNAPGGGGPRPAAPPIEVRPGTIDAALADAVRRGLFPRLSPAQQKRARELGLVR